MVPIAALSRLNPHARAFGAGYRAIYDYKTLAAIVAGLEGSASLRFVRWTGKCNRCENGRFRHWDWAPGETVRCRSCSGAGRRTLRFTETHFADGPCWHHPWEGRWSRPGYDLAQAVLGVAWNQTSTSASDYVTASGQRVEWQDVMDWHPNMPAERLPIAELVPLLNEVEDWVEAQRPDDNSEARWRAKRAREHLCTWPPSTYFDEDAEPSSGYRLAIGRQPGGCFVCSSDDLDTYRYGAGNRQIEWSLPICKRHGGEPERAPHPKNPVPPPELITPEIRRWLDRHERIGGRA